LTTEHLSALVYIQFNLKITSKRERIKLKKINDVLISSETTEAQGFLFKGGDDCTVVNHRDEDNEEMFGTNIHWSVIGETIGVDEQLQRCQSARMRNLFEEEKFDSKVEGFEEDEDFMAEH
jgi:hypothetical protein